MKKTKKAVKKLTLNKETVANLQLEQVSGGVFQDQAVSDGPAHCWFSECASC